MNKKLVGILIILCGAILMVGLVYILFFNSALIDNALSLFRKKETTQEASNQPKATEQQATTTGVKDITKITINNENTGAVTGEEQITPVEKQEVSKDELKHMAASFSERFGSYSNQSNFKNIIDLKIFMSQRMQQWGDNYVSEHRRTSTADNEIYYGITTKAVSQEIKKYDDDMGLATVLVKTRRREATISTNNTSDTFNQDVIIDFVKERGAWKVNSATWQAEEY